MLKRDMLYELGYEDFVVFRDPDYDSAIIGISDDNRVIYDYDKMVVDLMVTDGMNMVDAAEFIDYNTIGSSSPAPERDPIIMYRLLDLE